ncbi:hypothetical protein WA026_004550 [Henosepilachna vigintioctopunctata]|uniref:Elongator complex protein 1 n=1 Tax=Henosepilachna vigintioctopunctata TaxID=420089 RepID=A0AAW1V0S6_9CUCU
MDNLKPLKIRCLPIDDIKGEVIYVSLGEECLNKEVYYLEKGSLICVNLVEREKVVLGTDIINVISGEYMSTQSKITVSTTTSTVIVDCETKRYYRHEYDKEVVQIGWNNTYDYLAVVFKDGTVLTFVFDIRFQLISQGTGSIHSSVQVVQDVGWGSKLTQFQGPKLADEVQSTEPHLTPVDDLKPRITWRGNNDEFIVSFITEGVRQFKVFDHLCLPKACSRLLNGKMYGPIAWKPQGNIIAAAIFQDEKNCIALFEKNGLFKMMFPLVDICFPVTFLSWSACGKVLNVAQEDQKKQTHICLYITSNYRWYMKQHLFFSNVNSLCTLNWTLSSPHCVELMAVSKSQVLHFKYKFVFDYDRKHNLIAAINGKTLRIHGSGEVIDPPPSCTDIIVLDNPINMITFHPSKDIAAAIDSANNLYCFSVNGVKLTVTNQVFLSKPVFPLNINHLFFKGNNPHFLVENLQECSSGIYELDTKSQQLLRRKNIDVTLHAIEQVCVINDIVIIQDKKYRTIFREGENPQTFPNLPYALHIIPLQFGSDVFCLILTPEDDLYVEEDLIFRGITSMMIHNGFLLLTDATSLYSLKVNQYIIETLNCDGLSQFHKRPLNESARIACMIGNTCKVLLHTPRGNLEIISCRSMEVKLLEEMLSKQNWSEAIKFTRLSKLNWNLLIDLDSERFYSNLERIIEVCNSQHVLNAIVDDISDKNCLSTIYFKTTTIIPFTPLNKRRDFLTKLGDYLDQSGAFADYLPTIMKICVDQNDIEKAMNYTMFLLNSPEKEYRQKADLAVTLLRIHVGVEDLFKAALETFDLHLADFVAKKCQMNPQEIDPIINELKTMGSLETRLSIHLRYQNWEEAICYMLRKPDLDKNEILNFIEEHDVARRAYLEMLKLKISFKTDIAKLYAESLISAKCHDEAAIILVQHSLYDEAVQQFKLAFNVRKFLEYLPLSSFTDANKLELYKDFAQKLIMMEKICEAALLYDDYLEDHLTAVKTLADGKEFVAALALARKYRFYDFIDINILPEMICLVNNIMKQVDEYNSIFEKYFERLMKLRNFKKFNFDMAKKRTRRHHDDDDDNAASIDSFGSNSLKVLEKERITEFNAYFQIDNDLQSVISSE